jgi:hypothetical protein
MAGGKSLGFLKHIRRPEADFRFKIVAARKQSQFGNVVNTTASANYVAFGKGLTAATPAIYVHGQVPGATADTIYE